ncbi:hypothetical protein [Streptomyces misionensis]|uniref:hypothetical protein n=1 Tax=Streptomyces misionensis TaxID=67331 RepID=UPI0034032448
MNLEPRYRPHLLLRGFWSGQFGVNIKSVGVPPFGDAIAFTQGSVADRPIRRRRALPVDFTSPPHECSVAPTYWGTLPELMEVITHARQEKIKVLVERFPLQRADEAYQLLHDGRIQGRAVITPHA